MRFAHSWAMLREYKRVRTYSRGRAMKESLGYRLIQVGRRLFVGTPIQRLKITSVIYARIFHSMYAEGDATTEYKGVKLTLPTKDTTIVPSILGGYFESLELDFFARAAAGSNVVLDVGANVGLYSCVAGTNVPPQGVVYAFEPITENVAYFQKNLLNNGLRNVEIYQLAMGEGEGELEIFVSSESIATHSASSSHSGGDSTVTVPMTSIDAFVESKGIERVDLLKIDVEGYDGYVLRGSVKTIESHRPTIFIEYDPNALRECGFEPDAFAELLFANYQYCLKLDEVGHKVASLSREALLALPVYANENLIFTNQANLTVTQAAAI
jgi:FkbM family methyltransferase